mmetsp:Transcript_21726/g.66480  ORF Transcript_21726/g.66480 Transcript_21726/m.66480 type:complete len:421 (-) Transcript_21726:207-1469(-)
MSFRARYQVAASGRPRRHYVDSALPAAAHEEKKEQKEAETSPNPNPSPKPNFTANSAALGAGGAAEWFSPPPRLSDGERRLLRMQRVRRRSSSKRKRERKTLKELISGRPLESIQEGAEGENDGDSEARPAGLANAAAGVGPDSRPGYRRESKIFIHVPESTLHFHLCDSLAAIFFGRRAATALGKFVTRAERVLPVVQFIPLASASLIDSYAAVCVEDREEGTMTCTRTVVIAVLVSALYGISAVSFLAQLLTANVEIFKVAMQMTGGTCITLGTIMLCIARAHISAHSGYFGPDAIFYQMATLSSGVLIGCGDALAVSSRCIVHRYTSFFLGGKHFVALIFSASATSIRTGTAPFINAGNLNFTNQAVTSASRFVLGVAYFIAAFHAWKDPHSFTFLQAKLRTTIRGPVLETKAKVPS